MCGFTAVPESKVSMGLSNQMSCWEHEGHLLGSNTERATLWPFSTSPIYTFGTVHIRCTWIIRSGVSHGWLLLQTSEMIVSCINEHVCVGCVCYMWENILLSRHVGSVLLIVDTKQPQGEGTDTYIWLGTISVTENRLLGTFNGTRRQQSDKRDIFLLSSVQWEWPQQTRVRLSATLVKHDKGKGPAAAALTAPSKHRKKPQRWNYSPKLPVWAAYCCWVFRWGSWAVLWSSRWPCAALWLKARRLPLRAAVRQCDAVETRYAAAERRRRRSGAAPSLASSSFSTSFSLLLSHAPRTHAVHGLTGRSTRSSFRFNKGEEIKIHI